MNTIGFSDGFCFVLSEGKMENANLQICNEIYRIVSIGS